jgi:hypothetical protein
MLRAGGVHAVLVWVFNRLANRDERWLYVCERWSGNQAEMGEGHGRAVTLLFRCPTLRNTKLLMSWAARMRSGDIVTERCLLSASQPNLQTPPD